MKKIIYLVLALFSTVAYSQTCPTQMTRSDSVVACKLKVKNLGVELLKSNSIGTVMNAVAGTDYVVPSGSISGNSATSTQLQTARTINGVSFNGTANITIPITSTSLSGLPTDTNGTPFIASSTVLNSFANIQRRIIDNTSNHNLSSDLAAGISTSILVLGNSTESDTTTWPYKYLKLLNTKYGSTYNIKCNVWSAAAQDYGLYPEFYLSGNATNHYALNVNSGLKYPYQLVPFSGGDIEVKTFVNATSYASGSTQALIGRYSPGGTVGFRLAITSTGLLQFLWSADGTTQITKTSTVTLPSVGISNGTDLYLKATLKCNNGASGNDLKFYYSTNGTSYTQLGSTVTTAGVTSIYTGGTIDYELGVTGTTANPLVGKIYATEIRDTIAGPVISPRSLDSWIRYASGVSWVGNPVLSFWIGGNYGYTVQQLSDPVRVRKMIPFDSYSAVLIADGHNDGPNNGGTYLTLWDAWLSLIRSRVKTGDIFVVGENPEKSPATTAVEQAKKQGQLGAWAFKNGCKNIPTLKYFYQCPNYLQLIQSVDGIHPTAGNSGGYQFWAQIVFNILN